MIGAVLRLGGAAALLTDLAIEFRAVLFLDHLTPLASSLGHRHLALLLFNRHPVLLKTCFFALPTPPSTARAPTAWAERDDYWGRGWPAAHGVGRGITLSCGISRLVSCIPPSIACHFTRRRFARPTG